MLSPSSGRNHRSLADATAEIIGMTMYSRLLVALVGLALSTLAAQHTKSVQKACASDYKRHCGQYGIETEALRLCMDRAGQRLTKTCIDALVADGEVSKQRSSGVKEWKVTTLGIRAVE